jgi:hypothetical protein
MLQEWVNPIESSEFVARSEFQRIDPSDDVPYVSQTRYLKLSSLPSLGTAAGKWGKVRPPYGPL